MVFPLAGFGGDETELVFRIRRDQGGAKDDGGCEEAQGSDVGYRERTADTSDSTTQTECKPTRSTATDAPPTPPARTYAAAAVQTPPEPRKQRQQAAPPPVRRRTPKGSSAARHQTGDTYAEEADATTRSTTDHTNFSHAGSSTQVQAGYYAAMDRTTKVLGYWGYGGYGPAGTGGVFPGHLHERSDGSHEVADG